MVYTKENLCKCPCHQVGMSIRHCMPCCIFCYIKYLDEDGNVIDSVADKIIKEANTPPKKDNDGIDS
jgi:DNA repair photolyase